MKIKFFFITLPVLLLISVKGFAADRLTQERIKNIHDYVENLQEADVSKMKILFEKKGIVYSTSEGKRNAITFFSTILPYLKEHHAKVELHAIYKNNYLPDTYLANFTLAWKDENGKKSGGNFADIFKFRSHQISFNEVDMFEAIQ